MTQFDMKIVPAYSAVRGDHSPINVNFVDNANVDALKFKPEFSLAPTHVNEVVAASTPVSEYYFDKVEFFVESQGTIKLKLKTDQSSFRVYFAGERVPSDGKTPMYVLEVSQTAATFRDRNNNEESSVLLTKSNPEVLLEAEERNYWFSIDKSNKKLKYGKGDATESLTLMTYTFEGEKEKTMLKNLKYIGCSIYQTRITDIEYYIFPVTFQLPPFVAGNNDITLEDIEIGHVTAIGNLPEECQKLHSVVAGNSIKLEEKVIQAIRKSLKDGALKKKLEEKKGDHTIEETYLRVTLGMNGGYSPGVPFVLELWPLGHRSSIHRHSEAFAIIKVLFGEIHCDYFSDLSPTITSPYMECNFKKDQITYLTPALYQTHQLKNTSSDFCATIQCYRYANDDRKHFEFFSYINEQKKIIENFTPNSDFTYTTLIETLKKEGNLK